jgi:tRNA 2-selenouridine synthase
MTELAPSEFLEKSFFTPIIDVRSPKEYENGHIPGAINIPLFEDDERSIVGILYKNQGRKEAIRKGLEIVGPKMSSMVDQALTIAKDGEVLVHCWRGGMRSSSVAWLFEASDFRVSILQGGYKNYRHYIRENMLDNRKLLVLGGLTGTGKTNIIRALRKAGEPAIDLEGLANHRGSAFGSVGLYSQPSTEHFENLLYEQMQKMPQHSFVWIEDESRRIGEIFIPEYFHQELRKARVIFVQVDDGERMSVLLDEYARQPPEELVLAIEKLRKRFGGLMTQQALDSVNHGNYERVIELLLPYYDKLYAYGLSKREPATIEKVDLHNMELGKRIEII